MEKQHAAAKLPYVVIIPCAPQPTSYLYLILAHTEFRFAKLPYVVIIPCSVTVCNKRIIDSIKKRYKSTIYWGKNIIVIDFFK